MADKYAVQVDINAKDAASHVVKGFGASVSHLGDVVKGILGAQIVQGLARGLKDMATEAVAIPAISQQFERLGGSIEAMRKGSAGMVADIDLMKSFNRAASLVSVDFAQKLPDAMSLLGKAAAASGQDVNYMLESLVLGVGRVSPMILDNLGIQVSLSEATETYAKSIGKSVEELTKQEQQSAVMAVVMEKLQGAYGGMADVSETAKAKFATFGVMMQNIRNEIGVALLPILTDLMGGLSRLAADIIPRIVAGIEAAKPVIAGIGTAISMAFDVIRGIGGDIPWEDFLPPGLADIAYQVSDAFAGLSGVVGQLGNAISSAGPRLSSLLGTLQSSAGTAFTALRTAATSAMEAITRAMPGLRATFEGLLSTAARVLPSIASLFSTSLSSIASLVATVLPLIIENWRNMVEQVTRIIGALIPAVAPVLEKILALARRILEDIVPFVMGLASEVQTFIADITVQIAGWLNENRELIEGTLRAIETIWNAVWPVLKVVVQIAFEAIKIIIGSAVEVLLNIVKLGMQVINGDWEGAWETFKQIIVAPLNNVLEIIKMILGKAAEAIGGKVGEFLQLGADLIGGLVQGLQDNAGKVLDAMLGMVRSGIDAVKRFFGIGSPAKLTIRIGEDITDGLVIGIEAGAPDVSKAMQQVVSSISKALKDLASAFHQMNKIRTEGGIPNLALWAETLKKSIILFSSAIADATREVKDKTIRRAQEFAGKIEEIFELLRTLGSVMRDLNEVEVFPDMRRFAGLLTEAIIHTTTAILAARDEVGEKALKAAAKLAEDIGAILQLVNTSLDISVPDQRPQFERWAHWLMEMISYATWAIIEAEKKVTEEAITQAAELAEGVGRILSIVGTSLDIRVPGKRPPFEQWAHWLMQTIEYASYALLEAGRRLEDGLGVAADLADDAGQVLGVVGSAVDALARLPEVTEITGIEGFLELLVKQLDIMLVKLRWLAEQWVPGALDNSALWAEGAGKVLGVVGSAVEALAKLPEVVSIEGIEGLLDLLVLQMDIMLVKLRWLAEQWDPGALDAAAAWAQTAGQVLGIVKTGVEALKALAEYTYVVGLDALMEQFTEQVGAVLTYITGLADSWAGAGLEAVATFAGHVKTVAEGMKSALDFLTELAKYAGGNVQAAMTAMGEDLDIVWEELGVLAERAQSEGVAAATAFKTHVEILRGAIDAGMGVLGGLGLEPTTVLGALEAFADGVKASMEAAVEYVGNALTSIEGLLGESLRVLPPQAMALGDMLGRNLYTAFSGWLGQVRADMRHLDVQVGGVERRIEEVSNNYYTIEAHYARAESEGDLRHTLVALQMAG